MLLTTPKKVKPFREAVSAAALLHDIGHIAPGSHTAYKVLFPDSQDMHEILTLRIIKEDPILQSILNQNSKEVAQLNRQKLLEESSDLPPWTWEIISGGGWNTDRGNWCVIDSIMAGVNYGKYNIPALIDALHNHR